MSDFQMSDSALLDRRRFIRATVKVQDAIMDDILNFTEPKRAHEELKSAWRKRLTIPLLIVLAVVLFFAWLPTKGMY